MVRLEGHLNLKTKGTQIIRKYIKNEKRDQLREKERNNSVKKQRRKQKSNCKKKGQIEKSSPTLGL